MMASSKGTGPLATISVETTLYLIDLYRSHDALWDIRHPNYRSHNLKKASWTSVRVNFVKKTGIDCTDEHIQKKVVALRNTFTRELRLLRDSKKSGLWAAVRKPTWPFYSAMQFLRGVITIVTPATANISDSSQDSETDILQLPAASPGQCITDTVHPGTSQDSGLETEEGESQKTQAGQEKEETPSRDVRDRLHGRKRKIPLLHPLEATLQKFIEIKQGAAKQPVDVLLLWSRNLVETMRGLKEKRRKLLRIQIDELLAKTLREDLDSDTE